MYIITNTTMGNEYTPSKANTLAEAQVFMTECTANNIRAWKGNEHQELENMSNEEVIAWATNKAKNGEIDFSFENFGSEIYYNDESYNIMNIYDLDQI